MSLIILLVIIFSATPVYADDYFSQQHNAVGYSDVIDSYSEDVAPYLEKSGLEFSLSDMTDSIYKGKFEISPSGIIDGVWGLLTGCLRENFSAMSVIMMLSVLSGFMTGIASLGNSEGSTQAAFYVCFCVICGVCATAFVNSVENAINAIQIMSDFVKVSAPALLTVTAVSGHATTAALFSPVLYSVAAIAVSATSGILVPLIYGAFSLSTLGCIGDGINLDRTVKLIKNIVKWIMGFFLTVFSAIAAAGKIATGSLNAVVSKTARFAVGNFIPLVGGMLSDSIDMIVTCTKVVKGAVGTGVAAVIVLVFAACGVQLVAQLWLFRIAAAFTAPIADQKVVKLIDDIADCISMMFSALCMSAFLFLIVITFMISGVML